MAPGMMEMLPVPHVEKHVSRLSSCAADQINSAELNALRVNGQDYDTAEESFCTLFQSDAPVIKAPARRVLQNGAVCRLNLLYWRTSPIGFAPMEVHVVPSELESRGLKREVWRFWTSQLASVNQDTYSRSCYFAALCMTGFLGACCVNAFTARSLLAWNQRLLQWQDDFNKVLEPLGIFCKSQSEFTHKTDSFPAHPVSRWIAFAFTPEQIEALKAEPHQRGKQDHGCSLCCETDESRFCMHP